MTQQIKQRLLPWLCLPLVFTSCDNLWEYHPYEGRISGETGILTKNVAEIEEIGRGRKTFKFAFITDTQRAYDDTKEAVDHINARGDIDFVLHGGDLSDFGATNEFEWMRDELNRLQMPYATVIGNHDCVGHGEHIYATMYGDDNYGFTVGHTRIECLNTVALEYDYSNPVPDFDFMKAERELVDSINSVVPDSITHTLFVMHAHPGDEQFNNNVMDAFNYYVCQFPGMRDSDPRFTLDNLPERYVSEELITDTRTNGFCLYGHCHHYDVRDIFDNGILYYGCVNIHKREYFVFTIYESGYDYERIYF
jgi:hypothetical protein